MSHAKLLRVVFEFIVYGFKKIPYVIRCAWHQATCKNMWRNVKYGPRKRNHLDVYLPDPKRNVGRFGNGVILVVHGGAWYWGTKMYFSRVQATSFPDCTVAVMNYSLHPNGACDVMVDDVTLAAQWCIDNLSNADSTTLKGDSNTLLEPCRPPLVIIAHSAGAHLVALALVRAMDPPKGSRSLKLEDVGAFVGISGVYKISDHFRHEADRGVADISPMCGNVRNLLTPAGRAPPVMGEDRAGWDRFSPTSLVAGAAPDLVRRLPAIVLIHGVLDKTVPTSSSTRFYEALCRAGHPECRVEYVEGGEHSDVFTDLNDPTARFAAPVAAHIRAALRAAADRRRAGPDPRRPAA